MYSAHRVVKLWLQRELGFVLASKVLQHRHHKKVILQDGRQ